MTESWNIERLGNHLQAYYLQHKIAYLHWEIKTDPIKNIMLAKYVYKRSKFVYWGPAKNFFLLILNSIEVCLKGSFIDYYGTYVYEGLQIIGLQMIAQTL